MVSSRLLLLRPCLSSVAAAVSARVLTPSSQHQQHLLLPSGFEQHAQRSPLDCLRLLPFRSAAVSSFPASCAAVPIQSLKLCSFGLFSLGLVTEGAGTSSSRGMKKSGSRRAAAAPQQPAIAALTAAQPPPPPPPAPSPQSMSTARAGAAAEQQTKRGGDAAVSDEDVSASRLSAVRRARPSAAERRLHLLIAELKHEVESARANSALDRLTLVRMQEEAPQLQVSDTAAGLRECLQWQRSTHTLPLSVCLTARCRGGGQESGGVEAARDAAAGASAAGQRMTSPRSAVQHHSSQAPDLAFASVSPAAVRRCSARGSAAVSVFSRV